MHKVLSLSPLLLYGKLVLRSVLTPIAELQKDEVSLCSETDCGQDPPTRHRACKADAEINTISAELEACCL